MKRPDTFKVPDILLDENDYPTPEYISFLKNFNSKTLTISDFLEVLEEGWAYPEWGFKLGRKYKGIRKLELHTGGWSGNEEIIREIKSNMWLTHFKMRYIQWRTGGHFYFEISE